MKILFQGDSITDAGRNREDYHDLGRGYPLYAAKYLKEMCSDTDFEFIDLGIGGHQTKDLVARLQSDFVDIDPDIVSILIGINDVWHHASDRSWLTNEYFENNYRTILQTIKDKTHAKIVMMEPFLIPVADKLFFREDLDPKIQIVRKLAIEYADLYIPCDGLLAAEFIKNPPTDYAADGVHPTPFGADFLGKVYAEKVKELI
ncbi:MAG: GDSL family lipase [Ruminococcaceae bacterium]|nr:GDSL family lipase [Oscillospiraceae bacterium]